MKAVALVLLLCFALTSLAQGGWSEPDSVEQEISGPAEAAAPPVPEVRYFDQTALEAYRADPTLQYELPEEEQEPGLWDRFMAWLSELLGVGNFNFGTRLNFAIVIAAAILLFMAVRRGVFTGAFRGAPRTAMVTDDPHEELHSSDLSALITAAEAAGEWRRAIRLRYLQVLRHGIDKGWFHWRPEHTDRDYAQQLEDPALRDAFGRIAFTFQWVWYGEAPLDRARYEALTGAFQELIDTPGA